MPRARTRRRHDRGARSSIAGPVLPLLESRQTRFEDVLADAAEYLMGQWPDELAGVRFRWADMPPSELAPLAREVPQWWVDHRERTITVFRLPIQRLVQLHVDDDWHKRVAIESCIFRAAAELIGREPWEIAPDRYRHH
ncbi:metallopeptidase family protein [Agrococcus jejuensis]|uniref:metallopeptidase family protein n=1 Tax=Agrococcus jejuensis TaxID=399736 RepID=UPI000B842F9D|nr:metallopeptidase family protein [Agrococcus jejuensis]